MTELRIVFLGTPEFAVASLQILVENKWPIVAVITVPDRKKGRGQAVSFSPIKTYALKNKIPVLQPTNLKSVDFLKELSGYSANLQIVVAFRMLPEVVWQMPALGTFNLHASLLPKYRGAAPINWAIINGEIETGVTTFFLKHEIDTGEIILQEKEIIHANDTAGSLYERLMIKGAKAVLQTVELIKNENITTHPQSDLVHTLAAPKIFKETCKINWLSSFQSLQNFIRGLNPYPAARTKIAGKNYKIYSVGITDITSEGEIGSMRTDHKTQIIVKCNDGWLEILELQIEGKKRMATEDFLRGNPLNDIPGVT